jgi:glycosyltransferase involved in cell wall biosynthesis
MAKLLIYIPTFNRPEQLRNQLRSLHPQIEENSRQVRVIVADNNSTDERVKAVIEEFKSFVGIEFTSRTSNIDGNANILLGFIEAKQDEYLWLLADDTNVTTNAVSNLLSTLNKTSVDLLALYTEEQRLLPESLQWNIETFKSILDEFRWGLISSAIYNMGYFSNSIKYAFFFHNSSFPHLGVLFSEFKRKQIIKVAWLPERDVHKGNSTELPSDYSLSLSGFPHLFTLFDLAERRDLLLSWVRRYGVGFLEEAGKHEVSSLATRAMIQRSGFVVRASFCFAQLEWMLRRSYLGRRFEFWLSGKPHALGWIVRKSKRVPLRIHTKHKKDRDIK